MVLAAYYTKFDFKIEDKYTQLFRQEPSKAFHVSSSSVLPLKKTLEFQKKILHFSSGMTGILLLFPDWHRHQHYNFHSGQSAGDSRLLRKQVEASLSSALAHHLWFRNHLGFCGPPGKVNSAKYLIVSTARIKIEEAYFRIEKSFLPEPTFCLFKLALESLAKKRIVRN